MTVDAQALTMRTEEDEQEGNSPTELRRETDYPHYVPPTGAGSKQGAPASNANSVVATPASELGPVNQQQIYNNSNNRLDAMSGNLNANASTTMAPRPSLYATSHGHVNNNNNKPTSFESSASDGYSNDGAGGRPLDSTGIISNPPTIASISSLGDNDPSASAPVSVADAYPNGKNGQKQYNNNTIHGYFPQYTASSVASPSSATTSSSNAPSSFFNVAIAQPNGTTPAISDNNNNKQDGAVNVNASPIPSPGLATSPPSSTSLSVPTTPSRNQIHSTTLQAPSPRMRSFPPFNPFIFPNLLYHDMNCFMARALSHTLLRRKYSRSRGSGQTDNKRWAAVACWWLATHVDNIAAAVSHPCRCHCTLVAVAVRQFNMSIYNYVSFQTIPTHVHCVQAADHIFFSLPCPPPRIFNLPSGCDMYVYVTLHK